MKKTLFVIALVSILSFQSKGPAPEKSLKLDLSLAQANLVLTALQDCDCPQKSAKDLREYIIAQYNVQFPAPAKDTTRKVIDSTKKP